MTMLRHRETTGASLARNQQPDSRRLDLTEVPLEHAPGGKGPVAIPSSRERWLSDIETDEHESHGVK